MFERYTRLDPDSGGTGIGLDIARSLLRCQGGGLVAHSDGLGLASTFVLKLPARQP